MIVAKSHSDVVRVQMQLLHEVRGQSLEHVHFENAKDYCLLHVALAEGPASLGIHGVNLLGMIHGIDLFRVVRGVDLF